MKKVLIVCSNQVDLDAAKTFFSTIPGYDFLFHSNRLDAQAILESSDILITDANIPYSPNDSIDEYPHYFELINNGIDENDFIPLSKEEAYAAATGLNGWALMLQVKTRNIPNLMIGEYGTFKKLDMLKIPDKASQPSKELLALTKGDTRKNWREFAEKFDSYWNENHQFFCWCQHAGEKSTGITTDWEIVWEQIKKQLNNPLK